MILPLDVLIASGVFLTAATPLLGVWWIRTDRDSVRITITYLISAPIYLSLPWVLWNRFGTPPYRPEWMTGLGLPVAELVYLHAVSAAAVILATLLRAPRMTDLVATCQAIEARRFKDLHE